MAKLSKRHRSKTSVGRFLLDVIKPTPALTSLGKRGREDSSTTDSDEESTRVDAALFSAPLSAPAPGIPSASATVLGARPARVALQNEDSTEDAIVITALDVVPFCCHADLVTMNRPQLLAVAATMNAKLPLAMQIDTCSSRSDASIRHSIELLVGLRNSMPEPQTQPRRFTRSRAQSVLGVSPPISTPRSVCGIRGVPPSPASPLAGRVRPSISFGTPSLAVLREDSEEDRPQKRRRTDAAHVFSIPFDPARPISRAQSRRVTPLLANPPAESTPKGKGKSARPASGSEARVLRTRSQPVYPYLYAYASPAPAPAPTPAPSPATQPRTPKGPFRRSGHTRAGYAASTKRHGTLAMTSTPKKRAVAAVNSPDAPRFGFQPLLADMQNARTHTDVNTIVYKNIDVTTTARGAGRSLLRAAREGEGEGFATELDVEEVTFGIDGLTMPMVGSGEQLANIDFSGVCV